MTTFLWEFARGDMAPGDFERSLYGASEIEVVLGRTLYLDLLETDFGSTSSVAEARSRLRDQLPAVDPQRCSCLTWRNEMRVGLGFETGLDWFSANFRTIARQTPWLDHVACNVCETDWYVATDTIEDDYHFHRMTPEEVSSVQLGIWPSKFDDLAVVWPSREWLELHGFESLEEWQRRNGAA